MPMIYLYAELLVYIRQLTLHASLETEKNVHTKILLSFDKKVITALHEGESASIYLPTQISGTANITFPLKRKTEISTKLQIEDLHQLDEVIDASATVEVPWPASAFDSQAAICCKSCSTVLLEPGTIKSWKNLPSENWAELMDLWFCHKPEHEHGDDSNAAESKGFSARSRLGLSSGTGFVDTLSILISPGDCSGIEMVKSNEYNINSVSCSHCTSFVGSNSTNDDGIRLWKSRIALRHEESDTLESHDSAVFIAAQLLHLIESSIGRRVVVHGNSAKGLLCWVFNPDLYYTSSKRGPTVHRAMKVFYKEVDEPLKLLDEQSSTLEELALPEQEFDQLRDTLAASAQILPQSARAFQDWQVGLLDRYEKHPSGQGVMDNNALNHRAPEDFEVFKLPEGWSELYV